MKASIEDVARLAGVSIATVSRVLNGRDRVSPQTRNRVLEAAHKLTYFPRASARGLATGKTGIVGIFVLGRDAASVHSSSWAYYLQVLRGVSSELTPHGYRCWLDMDTPTQVEKGILRKIARAREVDGLILFAQWRFNPEILWELDSAGLPFVLVNASLDGGQQPCVVVDNAQVAVEAVHHLTSLGHRQIGFVTGPSDNLSVARRTMGYLQALQSAEIVPDPTWVADGDFTVDGGYQAMRALLGLSERPTAVFCINDHTAAGALRAVTDAGLRCPEDVSIVGVDDSEIAQVTSPPLTSVRIPLEEMGRKAAEKLLALISGQTVAQGATVVRPRLVVRHSTRPNTA